MDVGAYDRTDYPRQPSSNSPHLKEFVDQKVMTAALSSLLGAIHVYHYLYYR